VLHVDAIMPAHSQVLFVRRNDGGVPVSLDHVQSRCHVPGAHDTIFWQGGTAGHYGSHTYQDGEVRTRLVSGLVITGTQSHVIQVMQVSITDTHVKSGSTDHWNQASRQRGKNGSMGQG